MRTIDTQKQVAIDALLDSGAHVCFIDTEFVKGNFLKTKKLPRAIPVYNVDGTRNSGGSIEEELEMMLTIDGHKEKVVFEVCNLGGQNIILGHSWLVKHNPEVDWRTGNVLFTRCPRSCGKDLRKKKKETKKKTTPLPKVVQDVDEEDVVMGEEIDEWGPMDVDTRHIFLATETGFIVPRPKPSASESVPVQFHHYLHIFEKKASERLPRRSKYNHQINLKEGFIPKKGKPFHISPKEERAMDDFLNENLAKGYIRPSHSEQAVPMFFIKKDDGGLRPCQDYRYLNAYTMKSAYPLPLIADVIDKLKGAKLFTQLDLRWGYNNVRIKEGDEWKAAFTTARGCFEPVVMFFGLTNSPATFQAMMNEVFKPLVDANELIVYMDNIFIYTGKNEEEQSEIILKVLEICEQNDLFLKHEKCDWFKTEMKALGMIVTTKGVKMDPEKLEGIAKWPIPRNVTEVQAFLGMCNYYRRFIVDFSDIAHPLHDILKKDFVWTWSIEAQETFEKLKNAFLTDPILVFPDPK